MTPLIQSLRQNRGQYFIFLGLSFIATILTVIVVISGNQHFQRFLGAINPFFVLVVVILTGLAGVMFLLTRGWFIILNKKNIKGLLVATGFAVLFGTVIILVDLEVVFPADLNIPFPHSVSFYPLIGFVVETLFHILPLSLLLLLLTGLFKKTDQNKLIWIALLLVACLEPVYQLNLQMMRDYSISVVLFLGVYIFLINLTQLVIFRRYDFISMFMFRLAYYIIWHIAWGYVRLELLF